MDAILCGNSGENRWKGFAFWAFPPYSRERRVKPLNEDPLAKEEMLEFEGIVEELLPNANFQA